MVEFAVAFEDGRTNWLFLLDYSPDDFLIGNSFRGIEMGETNEIEWWRENERK